MFDFIFAGIIYLLIMFVVFFCISLITIAATYSVAMLVRRCLSRPHQPDLALK